MIFGYVNFIRRLLTFEVTERTGKNYCVPSTQGRLLDYT